MEIEKLIPYLMPETFNLLESDSELKERFIAMAKETFMTKIGRYPKECESEYAITATIIEYYAMRKGGFNLSEITIKSVASNYANAMEALGDIKNLGDNTTKPPINPSMRFTAGEPI